MKAAHLWLVALLGFVSGIFLRSFFVITDPQLGLATVMLLALVVLARRRAYSIHLTYLIAVILFFSCALCGVVRYSVAELTLESERITSTDAVTLNGVVVKEPDERAKTQHLYIESETATVLVIADRYAQINYGDQVHVVGELVEPEAFTSDLGRTFAYPGYLRARGVTQMMIFPDTLEVVSAGEGNILIAVLLTLKLQFQSALRSVLPEPEVGLAEGLLLGEKRALGEELSEMFRQAGVIHIVVLSGYNVLLVAGFFLFILSWFGSLRVKVVGGVLSIVLFALLVGLSPTVVRASIMACILLVASALGRQYDILRALLVAGCIMLIIDPYLLVYDPGFQLSFLATLGLIFVAPQLESRLVSTSTLPSMKILMIATLATQISVLPLLLYQIGEFSVVALVVNALVLPAVPLAMLLTFLAGTLALFSWWLGSIVAYGAYLVLGYILLVVQVCTSVSWAALSVPLFPFWWVVVAYGAMGHVLWRVAMRDTTHNETANWQIDEEEGVRSTPSSSS